MKIKISKSQWEKMGREAGWENKELSEKLTKTYNSLTQKLGNKIKFYKENDSNRIYLVDIKVSLTSEDLSFLSSLGTNIYLSIINGQMAIFVFKK